MQISQIDTRPAETDADAVVVGVFKDAKPSGTADQIDRATDGLISRLIDAKEITGKPNEAVPILAAPGVSASQVLVVGLGEREKLGRRVAFEASGTAAKTLAAKQRKRVAFFLADDWPDELVESGVSGAIVGCRGQDLYRAEKKLHPPAELLWAGKSEPALRRGEILGESINLTRRLVNQPASEIYPESFAAVAAEVAEECGLEIEIWDEKRLEAERCGALLAVGRASSKPQRLVILKHRGKSSGGGPLALVGKGVTFDSGGLSIKTGDHMKDMKCDMAGAATVLGTMQAVAKLELPVEVVGIMGLVENLLSGDSYKVGDVLTARNGRTIEVHNTDAEGRLVLADALSLAVDLKAAKIVDVATLTGACVVALGTDVAGLMSNDQPWLDAVRAAADTCGEPAWPLPMFDDYGEQIKSEVADIKNVGEGRWGGAITAAKFLEEFVAKTPWTHIDVAGPAFREKPKPYCDAGASGQFVRTLVELAGKSST